MNILCIRRFICAMATKYFFNYYEIGFRKSMGALKERVVLAGDGRDNCFDLSDFRTGAVAVEKYWG